MRLVDLVIKNSRYLLMINPNSLIMLIKSIYFLWWHFLIFASIIHVFTRKWMVGLIGQNHVVRERDVWEDQIMMEGRKEGGREGRKERDRVSEDLFSVVHSFLHSLSLIRGLQSGKVSKLLPLSLHAFLTKEMSFVHGFVTVDFEFFLFFVFFRAFFGGGGEGG